ncbi:nucleotide 5'-monophosphate nucleosidase PpnN [Methylophaga sp. OBS3]|uniref:nucleotide 5'-monophosphate nucleosidase PpnN n=1 Tax=Methylophaga sp. OBS3 TaxID=2991934 RepID=UPI002250815D|nr:nucleotide 5'-monophosphate nucleosidase PpnN [Methylophaga sp. OBS3]MCX4189535.1 nucleotide 5'-monophosphate nucleosidase PpnN [Methylophaga sp. OBS3]
MQAKIKRTSIRPLRTLNLLSQEEIRRLTNPSEGLHRLFRDCALAILNTDSHQDDAEQVFNTFADFDIRLVPQSRGILLEIDNAPAQSFVGETLIKGIQEHLSSALRDIVYTDFKILDQPPVTPEQITDSVFMILRNANVVRPTIPPNMVVCWGGHSIPREEYDYAKHVGYELGLRGLDIITGCGIGAMKGPMKGAAVGHAKQQIKTGRYIGISEPGIIASESPNAIVNELIIMPDIEKRLEAFVRLGHSFIVFPGGVGTVEEIFYLLSILLHPENKQGIPLIFAGPSSCEEYFKTLDSFLKQCLGEDIANLYEIITGEPDVVAQRSREAVDGVQKARRNTEDAYYFNWQLHIDPMLQYPFIPTHENMASLRLFPDMPKHELAAQLRAAFSGIVAGNVKAFGIREVAEHGPYQINGDPALMRAIDNLLSQFVRDQRMKLGQDATRYQPCYQIISDN